MTRSDPNGNLDRQGQTALMTAGAGPAAELRQRLSQALSAQAVGHCFLPPVASPGPAVVEVLVDRQQAAAVERAVAGLGCKRLSAAHTRPGVAGYLWLRDADLQWVVLRVCTQLPVSRRSDEAQRLPWEQLVLSTVRRDDDGCAVPEPDLELLLRAVWAAAVGERQSGALADPAHLRALVERLLGAAAVAKLPDLDAAVRQALPAFVTGARRAAIAVRRPPVVQSGGLVVAFVGCDGSGKSTVTREIEQWLGQALRVDRAYLGSGQGSSSLLRWPLLLVHRLLTRLLPPRATAKASSPPAGSAPAEVAVAPAGPRGLRARLRPIWALALAREKVGKLRAVLRARQQGAVVICDRYPQNEIMGFNDGPLLHGWRQHRSGLCRALARWEGRPYAQAEVHPPDLVVKLCVSAAVALARKPDMNAPEVARRIAAIEMLRFGRDTRTLLVDADAPLAAVLRAVKTGIWGEL